MDLTISHFTLDDIFKRCSQKMIYNEQQDRIQLSIKNLADAWNAFIKQQYFDYAIRWTKSQLDLDRTIAISNFGSIVYKKKESIGEKEKTLLIYLSESFISQHNLKYRGEINMTNYPPIKISYSSVQKLSQELGKEQIKKGLDSIFQDISDIINTNQSVEINLGTFGKFNVFEKTIQYEPFVMTNKQKIQTQSTVKNLLDQRKGIMTQSMTSFNNIQAKYFPQTQKNEIQKDFSTIDLGQDQTMIKKNFVRRPMKLTHQSPSMANFMSSNPNLSSPTRRFKIEQINIQDNLLAAGTDPLCKNQDFSQLADNAKNLIQAQFKKPGFAKIRYPPILDKFSRTLAAPLVAQKHNLSVSGRIASNYTKSARKLYFDSETKGIKYFKIIETSVEFTANEELLHIPASLQEELAYILYNDRSEELVTKMQAKKICYERYRTYIENEISTDSIAPINHDWVTDILDLIPHQLQYVDRQTIENMINTMLNEINKDYYDSVRKSILDYVLKDESERYRIGIMSTFEEVLDYGDSIYKGIQPNDEWKDHVNSARDEISQNLVICSKATLDLMELWKKYEKMHFLVLPSKKDQTMTIQNFLEIQIKNIQEVKNHLLSEWHKDVIEIFKNELTQMNRNKKQAVLFFESNATLMSNQIRQLVTDSLKLFREFFERFNKPVLKTPQQVVEMEKDCKNDLQDVFLHIKLIETQEGRIIFADDLREKIMNEILDLIDKILKSTEKFPRPENHIARSDKTQLWDMPCDDEIYVNVRDGISNILEKNIKNVQKVLEIYEKYSFLLGEDNRIQAWIDKDKAPNDKNPQWVTHTRDEYWKEMQKFRNLYNEINQNIPCYVRMNMILIDGCDIKRLYLRICTDIHRKLQQSILTNIIIVRNDKIQEMIKIITEEIKEKAENTEKLVQIQGKITLVKEKEQKQIKAMFQDLTSWVLDSLSKTSLDPEQKIYQSIYDVSKLVRGLENEVEKEDKRLYEEKQILDSQVQRRKGEFLDDLKKLKAEINQLALVYNSDSSIIGQEDALKKMIELDQRIKDYEVDMNDILVKESQLDYTTTEAQYADLEICKQDLAPFYDLWFLVQNIRIKHNDWQKDKLILQLDPEEIEKESKAMKKTILQLKLKFTEIAKRDQPKYKQILTVVEKQINELKKFDKFIPLIRVFSNKGLKERHWEKITYITTLKKDGLKLKKIMDRDPLETEYKELEEVSDSATKEYNIERILDKMKEDWQEVHVTCNPWKETGTHVMAGGSYDEVLTILDDQIVKTVSMKGSPHAQIFIERITEWEDWLRYTLELFDIWLKVQQVWLWLEPVFSSPDIGKQLPFEGAEFTKVDFDWRNLVMGKVVKQTKVTEFTKDRRMLDVLKENHLRLERVQKGLNEFLEQKRSAFPRFYFLGSDELLEILSEAKDPLKVQPHLKKCFEGIQKLKFDDRGEKKIFGMFSSENEYIAFLSEVQTNMAAGNVDQWLCWVQDRMLEAIHYQTDKSFNDYQNTPRKKWVLNRCGMTVLSINMTYWTFESEKALQEGKKGVANYADKLTTQLNDIVDIVRSDINNLDRCTIEALIVIDVHNKEILENLSKKGIDAVSDFEWQAQLRYYWQEEKKDNIKRFTQIVKIINAVCDYNYEYLGNSSRLVITPLTDRCYRTLCGAIHLNYGGAPEGPAGTGKTETVKDLAKALSRHCVVYNCSDGLDYKAMGKFFKGLSQSGAWACFDEFNRINLEVLSVVAQQIQCIQDARERGDKRFKFEGTEIFLKPTCNCFITMNPGYAGRSELPDNLKVLFRSVAMMVPDYAMISMIVLYSFGFQQAKPLAVKIVTTYKLCSEQLSSQEHYDYGMRAVKSVLTAAGNLKRKYPQENEFILMLRAIKDVNEAKFLNFDIPLFNGIISDLFPGIKLPEIDYRNMYECIHLTLKEKQLQGVPYFIQKIIQLYEMILVRHGLMVVGLSFAGKTSALHVLQGALNKLFERGQMKENAVQIITLNPKSISMNQLYGWADSISNEWADGVLAVKFRSQAKDETADRKWLIFDGPVDAVWIENMNTVLDDNKKLCLNSGEIIAMNNKMNMIYEPQDLSAASPATVSRCGMIFMEPTSMGWKPFYQSWKLNLHKNLTQADIYEIDYMFAWLVDKCLQFIRQNLQEISPTQDQNLIICTMRIFRGLLNDLDNEDCMQMELSAKENIIDCQFIFSLVWGIGGSLIGSNRKKFDQQLKRLLGGDIPVELPSDMKPRKMTKNLPEKKTFYDFSLKNKLEGNKLVSVYWEEWVDANTKEDTTKFQKMKIQQILIKTADTERYKFLLQHNLLMEVPTLFCGPTGTGKSIYIKNLLLSLSRDEFMTIEMGFSAQTTSTQTQDIIDSKLDRVKKGVYGPKKGKGIIFVDDLNMPNKEKWGAQPPIEILRQMIDQKGWYDFKEKDRPFKQLINLIFIGAMGPPGGGRTFITGRLLRHFNLISIAEFDDESLKRIFGEILKFFFSNNNFSDDVKKSESKIVQATTTIYHFAMSSLLPTPAKSHYVFNLRDFAKVIFGICMSDKDSVTSIDVVVRLWTHEILRVFADRLINEEDRLLMLKQIKDVVKKTYQTNFDTIMEHLDNNGDKQVDTLDEIRRLMFSDVFSPVGVTKRPYIEITDEEKLQKACDEALENYNMMGDKPMDIVLFSFAIEHLLIISRILKQPGGHALLVGVGGSGRQSLSRLASAMNDANTYQIEISKQYGKNEWHEDLKQILRQSGGKGLNTVFLFTDSQIKLESFVEDINNLLNSCEVPNLFPADEKAELLEICRGVARNEGKNLEGTPEQVYAYFIEKCKDKLHIMLAFSPIGDSFRNRVRMFPSLINCCTIDWFFQWPQDALVNVAKKYLNKVDMDQQVKQSCTEMVMYFHDSTSKWATNFFDKLKRKYYVTPTSYLEMIITFQSLLAEKRQEVEQRIKKYENGYQQIIKTESQVGSMQATLTEMVPKIKQATIDTEQSMIVVSEKKEVADEIAQKVGVEEAMVQEKVDKANAIKDDCEADLALAMPVLQAAEKALNCLSPTDIQFMKTMKAPSQTIRDTMQAVCYIMYPNPTEKTKDKSGLKMVTDWWQASVKVLGDSKLLDNMKNFENDTLQQQQVIKLGNFLAEKGDDLLPDIVRSKGCEPAMNMIIWVKAIHDYYYVNLKVKPKKAALEVAQKEVDQLQAKLALKQEELKKVMDEVAKLNQKLNSEIKKKEDLEKQYAECDEQLKRAVQLIESLGGEKGRWKDFSNQLKEDYTLLTGNILMSSGIIAYLGAFTPQYRNNICIEWVSKVLEKQIPGSAKYSLSKVLGDEVLIRQWNIDGLPSDNFSTENAIIMSKSRRWPLCIDPQAQANKWIKKMEQKKGLQVIKLTDAKYLQVLENAIQFGKPVLLENVLEDLDPSLSPVLLKQTFLKGQTLYIKLGDATIEYSKDFKFYVTSKQRNPHYLPEISTKVTLINFMITFEGLNDQLLGILVKKERPDLEKAKEQLIIEGAENKKSLFEIENKILLVLSSDKNILTDESAIKILADSKNTANDISQKQIKAEQTEKEIDTARQAYQPVSQQASILFFTISDLNYLDPMYQYSLVYYLDLFTSGIKFTDKSDDFNTRLENLKDFFLYSLYSNICRSLFEKDKLVFSKLLCTRLLEFRGQLSGEHFRFLLTGGVAISNQYPEKPKADFVSDKSWGEICRLSNLEGFKDFYKTFYDHDNLEQYKKMFDSANPQNVPLPSKIRDQFQPFQYILVLRTIRPDKIIPAVQNFIIQQFGKKFIEPPPFDLDVIYNDSNSVTPLIFVLSPGGDPLSAIKQNATKKNKKYEQVSLGQGQGKYAEALITAAITSGDWVVLQNCHLATSWMSSLDKICEELDESKIHPEFRLWLTSYPSSDFPITILQSGIKMTNEPPKGLKANLQGSFLLGEISNPNFFDTCKLNEQFKKLLFGLCFFHAVIQERRKYGPLGWNIPYEFTQSDLRICVRQLKMFLDEAQFGIPYDALIYLIAECNYGGRVTDDKDRKLIVTLLSDYICKNTVENPDYKFGINEKYKIPLCLQQQEFLDYIGQLPLVTPPDVFGFHTNADITKDMNETNAFNEALLSCQAEGGSKGGQSMEEMLDQLCSKIMSDFPNPFNIEDAQTKYPVNYNESMNTVLTQEMTRFNKLIRVIRSSLTDIGKALKGLILLSEVLEKTSRSLFDGKIPELWQGNSYPSLKSLSGYIVDLRQRLQFLQDWLDNGAPQTFWLSGFYFTQSFLTGVLQNYARKEHIEIDMIIFDFEMQKEEPTERPIDGAYVYGLFLEGAKYNYDKMLLDESDPKILFAKAPMILLKPIHQNAPLDYQHYKAPVYKTSARRGVLATTGHSSNFVMFIKLPSDKIENHWIKRGVALLTQLDD